MLKFFPSNSTECRLSSNKIASKVHCLLFLPLSFSFFFVLFPSFFWLICHFNICWSTFWLDFPHMNGILVMLIHRTTLNELNYCDSTTHLVVLSSIRRLSWAYWGRFSVSTLFLPKGDCIFSWRFLSSLKNNFIFSSEQTNIIGDNWLIIIWISSMYCAAHF